MREINMRRERYRRKPASITDGDTFRLHKPIQGREYVRLSNVDTPEPGEKGYRKAKQQLAGMIGGRRVTIKPDAIRRRVIARVVASGKSVNERMRKRWPP